MTLPRIRISIATVMMLVVTAAAASALVARFLVLVAKIGTIPSLNRDMAALLILGIVLTGVALAARKGHCANQAMLQITLACLGFIYAISLSQQTTGRVTFYWLQTLFAILVVIPLVARRTLKTRLDRGPWRSWWMKTCEAVAFAYLNMMLVLAGAVIEGGVATVLR